MPARNKNSGAGKVPPSCEYMKNLLWRALGAEPGVVAMGLEHQDAGQAAHPVDVSEPGWSGGGQSRHRANSAASGRRCEQQKPSNTCPNPQAEPGFKFAEIDFSVDQIFVLVQGRGQRGF